jgi:hypothetical protein
MCPPAWICRNRPPIPLRTPTQLIGALHTTRHNKVLAPKVSEGTVSLASNHCANWQHGICTYVDVRVDRTQVRFYPKAVHAFCATESCTATSRRVCCPCNIGNGRISPREESSGSCPSVSDAYRSATKGAQVSRLRRATHLQASTLLRKMQSQTRTGQ